MSTGIVVQFARYLPLIGGSARTFHPHTYLRTPQLIDSRQYNMLERASAETLSKLCCWLYLVVLQSGPIHFALNVEVEFVALAPPVAEKRIEPLTFSELSASI